MAGQPEGAPRRKDAERNRRRLLAAAREVFRDRGVAATLNDVAHHAGLGVGTVYRHFANKEELIDALFEDMVETVDQYVREAAAEQDACDAALKAMIAGRRGNFINYRVDNSLTRDPHNFVDLVHYRAEIADRIQQGVAASIKSGSAAKIDF